MFTILDSMTLPEGTHRWIAHAGAVTAGVAGGRLRAIALHDGSTAEGPAPKDFIQWVERFEAAGPNAQWQALNPGGSPFQKAVWRALLDIPPGRTTSYSALAKAIGRPGAARAVGRAVGSNALALLIPCHRVVKSNGGTGGYRWGVHRKTSLLERERRPGFRLSEFFCWSGGGLE